MPQLDDTLERGHFLKERKRLRDAVESNLTGETQIKAPYTYGLGCWRNTKLTSSPPFLYFLSYGLSVCSQCVE